MIRSAAFALLLAALLSALPAQAFPGGRTGQGAHRQGGQQQQPPQRHYDGRQQQQPPQRMTPDERRQLRRDLRDANRDLPQRRDWRR